jgi:5-methylcytosine-specific restriction enzyme A
MPHHRRDVTRERMIVSQEICISPQKPVLRELRPVRSCESLHPFPLHGPIRYNSAVSTLRTMAGGWVNRNKVPRGPNGRGLCRWCSLEVPSRRFTFCSEYCVHEWKLRSQPAYLREQVYLRDKGMCAGCGADTISELRKLRSARGARRLTLMAHWGLKTRLRKSLWDADHIVPVVEGGGECDLGNLRTLCLRCHREATTLLRERRRRTAQNAQGR